jgi:hypothetical protein
MIVGAVLALLFSSGAGGQGTGGPRTVRPGPRVEVSRVGVGADVPDTIRTRRKAVRLSEAYEFRKSVHKLASYATLPLFVAEYAAGEQLITKGRSAPGWARDFHGVGAAAIAGLFGINTVTGGLNWWETRNQTEGRTWRTVHSVLMLLSDAGFIATGALANGSEGGRFSTYQGQSQNQNQKHKAMAVGSMSIATISYLMMLRPLRRD